MKYTLLFLLLIGCMTTSYSQSNLVLTLNHEGNARSYRLHLPPQYTAGTSLPLVFNLHGITSNALQQEFYTAFNSESDAEGFIVCHPDGMPIPGGTGNEWNVGFAGGSTVDDASFLNALIDELHAEYTINLSKVYCTGMSNGGYMSYKLACEYPNRIAAIASVTGSMVPTELAACNPGRAIPVMQIHGTTDGTVPYAGAVWTTGVESLVDWWVNNNGCMDGPSVTDVPDTNTDDGSTAELYEYTSCTDDVKVELYKVTGGGHTWPNAVIDIAASGNTNRDFTATQVIWDFFNQFELPSTLPVGETFAENVEINVFPNPANDFINIEITETKILQVSIFNTLGQLVLEKTMENENSEMTLSTSSLETGTYILKVETEKGIITDKLLKL